MTNNPATGEIIGEYHFENLIDIESKINTSHQAYKVWKSKTLDERISELQKLSTVLRHNSEEISLLITQEMGKPINESIAEIEKCAVTIDYYCKNAERLLKPVEVQGQPQQSYYTFEPMGVIFGIMPWNFPFWQVLRFAIPTLLMGNTVIIKHAPNTWGSAALLKRMFQEASITEGIFENLFIDIQNVEPVIAHTQVRGVTLTGSSLAGSSVASIAGKYIKKSVLELGGSDAFIVLADANVQEAAQWAVKSRFQNAGQTCISSKRWIVNHKVYDNFVELTKSLIKELKVGNPTNPDNQMGPIARPDLAQKILSQCNILENLGAKPIIKGQLNGNFMTPFYYELTEQIASEFTEELFGPVACIIKSNNTNHAINIANHSPYGLGASVWTANIETGKTIGNQLIVGSVFINGIVKSDASIPFGGINQSGYGRELGTYGLTEFANIKTYVVN